MNHDSPPTPPQPSSSPPPDAELEARIVAWVAGELSAPEIADLEKLVAAQPALAEFKHRIATVHALIAEAERPDPAPLRLSPERRAQLLQTLSAGKKEPAPLRSRIVTFEKEPASWSWRAPRFHFVASGLAAACVVAFLVYQSQLTPLYRATTAIQFKEAEQSVRTMQTVVDSDVRSDGARDVTVVYQATPDAAKDLNAPLLMPARPEALKVEGLAKGRISPPPAAPAAKAFELVAGAETAATKKNAGITLGDEQRGPLPDFGAVSKSKSRNEVTADKSVPSLGSPSLNSAVGTNNIYLAGNSVDIAGGKFYGNLFVDSSKTANRSGDSSTNFGNTGPINVNLVGAPQAGGGLNLSAGSGTTSAGGNVYIPNPHGIVIDQAAQINTGGFYASTVGEPTGFFSTNGNLAFTDSYKKRAPITSGGTLTLGTPAQPNVPIIEAGTLNFTYTEAGTANLTSTGGAIASLSDKSQRKAADDDVIKLDAFMVAAPAKAESPAPTAPADRDDPRPAARAKTSPPPAPPTPTETTTAQDPVSTFSLHVSDVSFRLAQAALARGEAPDPARIRPEEFYNAFDYGDPAPSAAEKIGARVEQSAHPFLQQRNLVRIALKVPATGRGTGTPLHLTVLLDTSGSMEREDRAASVRRALEVLVSLLGANDRLTLIGFARQPHLLAENLPGTAARQILDLVKRTPAEGGTNLEEALKLGSQLALRHRNPSAQNRLVLLTDGAANLGDSDPAQLATAITTLRQQGIAFDACGVGLNGLDDEILEALTRQGDGRYYALNSPADADAGFAQKLAGAFRPAAENVKVQVRFNPARVARYRLIGFEQHRLREEDFRNDQVDAAELAAEEAAVALYQVEVLPQGEGELGEIFVRFRDAATGTMIERSWSLAYDPTTRAFDRASPTLQLAGTAALLAEKLRGGPAAASIKLRDLVPLANTLRGHYAQDARVQQLVTMLAQSRRLFPD